MRIIITNAQRLLYAHPKKILLATFYQNNISLYLGYLKRYSPAKTSRGIGTDPPHKESCTQLERTSSDDNETGCLKLIANLLSVHYRLSSADNEMLHVFVEAALS
jgi:hypothetical protein